MGLKGILESVIALQDNMFQRMKNFLKMLSSKSTTALDGFVEQLQKHTATAFMLVCSIILAVQIFGKPISCTLKPEDTNVTESVYDECWYSDYFRFTQNSGHGTTDHQARYQHVALVLFFQGSFCFLVFGACRGIRWILEAKWRRRESHKHCLSGRCWFIPMSRLFFFGSHTLSFCCVCFNLSFMNWFLEGAISKYGFRILKFPFLEQSTRSDVVQSVFPRALRCFMGNGGERNSEVFCTVPINALSETIFDAAFLWFTILYVIVYLTIGLDFALLVFLFRNRRPCHITRTVVENWINPKDAMDKEDIELDLFTHGHNRPAEASHQINYDKGKDAVLLVADDLLLDSQL